MSAYHTDTEPTEIVIRGAREHNLRGVDVELPREKLVVITGLSGSGKSSLAFDTIYAEGQRRYVECMSSYARQFLGIMKKPDVDAIEGLSPAISIEQKSVGMSPRSTVGTVTEVYDFLRLLFAKTGTQYCVGCGIPVRQQTLDQIVDAILAYPLGSRLQVLSPVIRGRKGHYRELFDQFRRQGFVRVRVDGIVQEITEGMQLARYKVHNIDLVVDRLTVDPETRRRLTESVETAIHLGESGVSVMRELPDGSWTEQYFSTSYACPSCGQSYETPAPNMFSFNSPFGACPTCEGIGELHDFDPRLVVPDRSQTLARGAIAPIGKQRDTWLWKQLAAYCEQRGVPLDVPVSELADGVLNEILHGASNASVAVSYAGTSVRHRFLGVLPSLRHQYEHASTSNIRASIEKYFATLPCRSCNGARLKQEHLHIRIGEYNIADVVVRDIPGALDVLSAISAGLTSRQTTIAGLILREIETRLRFLVDVGLSYVTLHRSARTLSGGESQRIRLASQIGSQLVGVTYVLDEPSIGLHQHDNQKLIASLKRLRDMGNTVVVVEHDREMIHEADHVVDIGPGAGVHGGRIVASFEPRDIATQPAETLERSLTLRYLRHDIQIPRSRERRQGNGRRLELKGACGNNLRNVDLSIPLGTFTCVTGMSGSGKSTLVNDTLYPILSRHFFNAEAVPLPYSSIEGLEHIDKVIEIDQAPIGRTPRSNPATYTGLFTQIRDFFTMLPEAKIRGYKAGRFSFNVAGGRCEECEGAGIRKIEMNFLPDVYVPCETCGGKRYNTETLSVMFKGHSIADVLDLTVEEAFELFKDIPRIRGKLSTLMDVGLTYIKIGQQAPTLSGGEAQRVKLATELSKTSTGKTLYLLDEPTTGLHFEDVRILLQLLDRLVDKGNTVVVIEHNLDVITYSDHIIDLGPGGGNDGGTIVATGTPEEVAQVKQSLTGRYVHAELSPNDGALRQFS
ncbi:MAG: excinuclease ABC subunit UvrA [Candidatus Kapabacteria bacterium]|nr:excinuclease ABC subunit UvrA [Candidatus Kapabacteria bacterium]